MLKMTRKRGGRSYVYKVGMAIPGQWYLEEDGTKYKDYDEYLEATKPKPKVVKKKVVKVKVEDKD